MEKPTKIIIVVAVCLSFVINSVLFTIEKTRRSAEELAIIKLADINAQSLRRKEGGKPYIKDNGEMHSCIYKD